MRGRSRASRRRLVLESRLNEGFGGLGNRAFGFLRDTAVVLHGRTPQLMLMIDSIIRRSAPTSAMTRSRNEHPGDLSRQVAARVEFDPANAGLGEGMVHGVVRSDARRAVEGWELEFCGINELWRAEGQVGW